jgi:5'-nucleotidase
MALAAISLAFGGCAESPRYLRVLQSSDVHGYYGAPPATGPHAGTGGLRQLASVVDDERRSKAAVMLVDSGDMWSGTQLSDRSEGALGILAYNALGYSGAALGNHEFDYGPIGPRREGGRDPFGSLKRRLAEATFPILAANLIDRTTSLPPDWTNLLPSTIVESGGFQIGLIGVITEDTPTITFPHVGERLIFTDPTDAVVREAESLRAQGVDLVFVLAHIGGGCRAFDDPDDLSSCDMESPLFQLVRGLPEGLVDVVFGGHTHRPIAHRLNGVIVAQPGKYGRSVSVVDIRDTGAARPSITVHPPRTVRASHATPLSHALDAVLAKEEAAVAKVRAEDLGARLIRPLSKHLETGGRLGSFLCDVLRTHYADREICILNTGGLRADLEEGPITYGALYDVMPFGNRPAFMDLTGAELRQILRISASGAHGPPQVSGVHLTIDRARDACPKRDRDGDGSIKKTDRDRLTSLTLSDGSPIEDDRIYKIVTSSFLAYGGDSWRPILARVPKNRIRVLRDDLPTRDIIAAWLRRERPVLDSPHLPLAPETRVQIIGTEPDVRCGP